MTYCIRKPTLNPSTCKTRDALRHSVHRLQAGSVGTRQHQKLHYIYTYMHTYIYTYLAALTEASISRQPAKQAGLLATIPTVLPGGGKHHTPYISESNIK